MKKGFLHRNIHHLSIITKQKIIIGILIGIIATFSIYTVQYYLREVFRAMSITPFNDLLVLSDDEVNTYNLFFAFISAIFGQSMTISFWLYKPKKAFRKSRNYRRDIIHDQRFLNWYFIFWFVSLMAEFNIFFLFNGSFYAINLGDYKHLMILIIIVLFLQTWVSIRRIFLNKSIKWMLISAVIISIISFGISRINFTDYKSFNESILKNNIAYTYNLKLPKSNISHQIEDRSITSNLWIVNDKNSQQPKLFFDTTRYYINGNISEIKFKDLSTALYHKHNNLPDYYAFSTSITLLIDTSIKMKFVNQVLDKIYLSGFYRINYATRPIEDNNHRSPVDFKVITEPLFYRKNLQSQSYHDIPPPPPPPPSFQNQNSNLMAIELSINSRGDYTINNKAIKHKEVKNKLKSLILSSNYKYKIKLQIYSDISFGEYFDAKQIIHKAVMELRDEYCMKKYKKSFHDIWYLDNGYEIQKSLMKKIRYTLHEEFDGE